MLPEYKAVVRRLNQRQEFEAQYGYWIPRARIRVAPVHALYAKEVRKARICIYKQTKYRVEHPLAPTRVVLNVSSFSKNTKAPGEYTGTSNRGGGQHLLCMVEM